MDLRSFLRKSKGFLLVKLVTVKNLLRVRRFTSLHLTSINMQYLWRAQEVSLDLQMQRWAGGWKELTS